MSFARHLLPSTQSDCTGERGQLWCGQAKRGAWKAPNPAVMAMGLYIYK